MSELLQAVLEAKNKLELETAPLKTTLVGLLQSSGVLNVKELNRLIIIQKVQNSSIFFPENIR